eukprot:COSAG01_NODE_1466_length_10220_cov_15.883608_9_plen_48_part_00
MCVRACVRAIGRQPCGPSVLSLSPAGLSKSNVPTTYLSNIAGVAPPS